MPDRGELVHLELVHASAPVLARTASDVSRASVTNGIGTAMMVSVDSMGFQGNGTSAWNLPRNSITDDGRWVVSESEANNLVGHDLAHGGGRRLPVTLTAARAVPLQPRSRRHDSVES